MLIFVQFAKHTHHQHKKLATLTRSLWMAWTMLGTPARAHSVLYISSPKKNGEPLRTANCNKSTLILQACVMYRDHSNGPTLLTSKTSLLKNNWCQSLTFSKASGLLEMTTSVRAWLLVCRWSNWWLASHRSITQRLRKVAQHCTLSCRNQSTIKHCSLDALLKFALNWSTMWQSMPSHTQIKAG